LVALDKYRDIGEDHNLSRLARESEADALTGATARQRQHLNLKRLVFGDQKDRKIEEREEDAEVRAKRLFDEEDEEDEGPEREFLAGKTANIHRERVQYKRNRILMEKMWTIHDPQVALL
jgi:hypothetical protein